MERKRRKKKTDAERLRNAEDRNNILKCPFCAEIPTVPVEIDTPFGGTVDGGNCPCGAVYVYDRTGRMLGEAFSDALALAFEWNYDSAFSAAEDSYKEGVVRFNKRARKFFSGEGDPRDRSARFYFIRRKKA
jgi:hypothetical protein